MLSWNCVSPAARLTKHCIELCCFQFVPHCLLEGPSGNTGRTPNTIYCPVPHAHPIYVWLFLDHPGSTHGAGTTLAALVTGPASCHLGPCASLEGGLSSGGHCSRLPPAVLRGRPLPLPQDTVQQLHPFSTPSTADAAHGCPSGWPGVLSSGLGGSWQLRRD